MKHELSVLEKQHVNYILGSRHEDIMCDVYTGLSTHKRPPYIEDFINEISEVCLIEILERERETGFATIGEERWVDYFHSIWMNNDTTMNLECVDPTHSFDAVTMSVLDYVGRNKSSVLIKVGRYNGSNFINTPVVGTW